MISAAFSITQSSATQLFNYISRALVLTIFPRVHTHTDLIVAARPSLSL